MSELKQEEKATQNSTISTNSSNYWSKFIEALDSLPHRILKAEDVLGYRLGDGPLMPVPEHLMKIICK